MSHNGLVRVAGMIINYGSWLLKLAHNKRSPPLVGLTGSRMRLKETVMNQ